MENSINNSGKKTSNQSALRRYLDANPSLSDLVKFIFLEKRGILAADESGGSIAKKFASMKIEDTEKNRRDYRNVFLSTPNLSQYCGGVILFEETAGQKADDGKLFGDYLLNNNVLPGIKLDRGLQPLPNFPGENYTRGLDDLPERLEKYHAMGFRFAKWRSALEIKNEDGKIRLPSEQAIETNNHILALYALECQKAGIIPIVEPELVYDGDYNIETATLANTKIISNLMEKLIDYKVDLAGTILKCSMTLAGKQQKTLSTPEEVAVATVTVLAKTCPVQLGAVVFLSGGQTPIQASANFHAIGIRASSELPFPVSFSFARALQDPALNAWKGDNGNFEKAQIAFLKQLQKVAG